MHLTSLTLTSAVPLKAIDEMLRMIALGFVSTADVYSTDHPQKQLSFELRTSRNRWIQALALLTWVSTGESARRIDCVRLRLWEVNRSGEQIDAPYDATFQLSPTTGELNQVSFEKQSIDFKKMALHSKYQHDTDNRCANAQRSRCILLLINPVPL